MTRLTILTQSQDIKTSEGRLCTQSISDDGQKWNLSFIVKAEENNLTWRPTMKVINNNNKFILHNFKGESNDLWKFKKESAETKTSST